MKKVVFIGYMGSGKSIVAKHFAAKLGFGCLDLDEMIEKKSGMAIDKIFSTKGEIYFRKLENELFLEVLNNSDDLIISTGGGTPCYYNNHEHLNGENVTSIYLRASIDTLVTRLNTEKQNRPLVANLGDDEVKEFIAKHLFDRSFYYNQATFKVDVDDKSIATIVTEITELLT